MLDVEDSWAKQYGNVMVWLMECMKVDIGIRDATEISRSTSPYTLVLDVS